MMSYSNGFVAAIICNGNPLREYNESGERTVRVPFGSEYQIRLKNNHPVRALARILIDGMDISSVGSRFILQPFESVDLERFVVDQKKGNRFKFVESSNGEVQDPTAKENGLIEVQFWKELSHSAGTTIVVNSTGDITLTGNAVPRGASFDTGGTYVNCSTVPPAPSACRSKSRSDIGATVEGSESSQSFVDGAWFSTEALHTSIIIRMKGPKVENLSGWEVSLHPTISVKFNGSLIKTSSVIIENGVLKLWGQGLQVTTTEFVLR